jgi:uncharacterized membrane protein YccF (DUF307 family)
MASDDPSILIRGIWFFLVGWWLTGTILTVAWALNLTVVGLPIGIKLINYVPKALTLKSSTSDSDVEEIEIGGSSSSDEPGLVIRGVYFVFIGWWASFIWMGIAYILSLSIVGLPFSIIMFNKLPKVTSLKSV